jgi:large subunit ribosomal protein L4
MAYEREQAVGVEKVTGVIEVPVFGRDGASMGTITVDADEFGGKISPRLMHEAVLAYEANQRQGNHSTLRRGEVAGSTKKLFRQKGTGNARAGTKRTNKRRGGGTAKGPKPRDYEYHLPKKASKAATRMAILAKLRANQAIVVDGLKFDAPKTKEMAGILKKINVGKCLIGTAGVDANVYKSARNIEGVKVLPAGDFNTYVVLSKKHLILTREALESLRRPKTAKAE